VVLPPDIAAELERWAAVNPVQRAVVIGVKAPTAVWPRIAERPPLPAMRAERGRPDGHGRPFPIETQSTSEVRDPATMVLDTGRPAKPRPNALPPWDNPTSKLESEATNPDAGQSGQAPEPWSKTMPLTKDQFREL
jgi:hypothetical protein